MQTFVLQSDGTKIEQLFHENQNQNRVVVTIDLLTAI